MYLVTLMLLRSTVVKKDSQYCVTAPFFATIYHDNRNHLGCCNAFWITGKVMLLVPYFRKIANISIVSPQSCSIESYHDSIVEKYCCKLFFIFTFFKGQYISTFHLVNWKIFKSDVSVCVWRGSVVILIGQSVTTWHITWSC